MSCKANEGPADDNPDIIYDDGSDNPNKPPTPPKTPDKDDDMITKLDDYRETIDFSCETDEDCEIKDVHNCCGYYPECVNQDAEVNPELVTQICADSGLAGVCGFPQITACKCTDNKCEGYIEDLDEDIAAVIG